MPTSSMATSTSCGEKVSIFRIRAASGSRSFPSMGRMSMGSFGSDLHQSGGEGWIVQTRGSRGPGEPCSRMEVAVGVDINDVGHTLRRHPKVDPSIVLTVERCKGFQRDLHTTSFQRRIH